MICEGKAVQKGSFAVITQKCNKTANMNVKKLQFRHELTANDTSKTAKITKKGDYPSAHRLNVNVLLSILPFF